YGLPIGTERSGLIPTPDWKRKSYDQPWRAGDTINSAIGQGYVLTTPLQLAVMTARLATGRKVMPRLVIPNSEMPDAPLPEWPALDIGGNLLQAAREGMFMVSNTPSGTAYGRRIREPEYQL